MGKDILFFSSEEDLETQHLKDSLKKTPAERIKWAYKMKKIMKELNPNIFSFDDTEKDGKVLILRSGK